LLGGFFQARTVACRCHRWLDGAIYRLRRKGLLFRPNSFFLLGEGAVQERPGLRN